MKIIFLKDHLAHKQGDLVEVNNESANYLIRVKVAYEHIETSDEGDEPVASEKESQSAEGSAEDSKQPTEKKEVKSKREKKEITKPGAE